MAVCDADGGLFRRVILHGGTALTSWSLSRDPLLYTRRLAESVNCSSPSSTVSAQVLRCLKRLPVEYVVEKAWFISAPRLLALHCTSRSILKAATHYANYLETSWKPGLPTRVGN